MNSRTTLRKAGTKIWLDTGDMQVALMCSLLLQSGGEPDCQRWKNTCAYKIGEYN